VVGWAAIAGIPPAITPAARAAPSTVDATTRRDALVLIFLFVQIPSELRLNWQLRR
jgi:hypothetical protein